jgi:hypothetical protein
VPKSAQRADELDRLAGAEPVTLPEYVRPPEAESAYPSWATDLINAGWIDPAQMEEMAARGMDISSPESWQSALGRFNEEEAMAARDQARNDQFGNDMA